MNKTLVKSTFRSIKNTFSRFVAIFAIIAIGCGFYAGIKASGPDMKEGAWNSYTEYNLADVHLLSTLGFENDDINAVKAYDYTESAEAAYTADLYISSAEITRKIVKAYSYDPNGTINVPELKEGRMPQNSSECVIDYKFYSSATPAIGETILLETDDSREMEDILSRSEYTVVGYVQMPMYIAFERGTTSIGNGVINGYVLIPEENFTTEVYTDIYVSLKDADKIDPFTDEYDDFIEERISELEEISEERIDIRVNKITDEAYVDINKAKDELSEAENDIADAKKQLADGETEYNDGLRSVYDLKSAVSQLDKILTDYETDAASDEEEVNNAIEMLNEGDSFSADETLETLIKAYMMMPAAYDNGTKTAARIGIEQYISGIEEQIPEAENSLLEAKNELDDAKQEISDGEAEIADAKQEIADAEEELADTVKDAKWYVFSRDDYYPYFSHYGEDCDRIDAIAKVFPIFFILVAALVCWTTMTRMVEEQRIQIGTLKALGYGRSAIILQYILYALAASIPGALIGLAVCFKIIPSVIFQCYQTMYVQDEIETPFRWGYALGCIIAACLCTGLSSVYACRKELFSRPAELMRAKPPKNGKRIFMEKITFIWNKLKFSHKVTFRNLFRYKGRVIMTVIGVGGCTALLLTGFGLRYSIVSIVDHQYIDIFKYDALVAVDSDKSDYDDIMRCIDDTEIVEGTLMAMQKSADVYNDNGEIASVYLVVPEDIAAIKDFVGLHERKSKSELELSDSEVIINEKLARVLSIKVGDTIHFNDGYDIIVSGIAENYTFNYVYMSPQLYNEAGFDAELKNNMIYLNMNDTSKENELSEALVNRSDVLAVTYSSGGGDKFRELVSSLSLIVVVIIAAAGALAFVVMFNLANINVNERIHELATIKVLGFYDGEVAAYIYRENTISALLGMASGLIVGIFFERFVIRTAEVDAVMFAPDIPAYCFLLAGGMTILFALIVNLTLYFRLKKIDMAASLKAIE